MSVHMRETLKHIANGNAFDELLPLLVGKVFHVTKEQNWPNISASGKLLPLPPEGKHVRTFGTNSYFQQQGCICLFDYRSFYEAKPQKHFDKCLPTMPLTEDNPLRVLFLNPAYYNKLVSWSQWHENGISTNVVPYIEAGLRGEVPLSFFDEALIVTITEDKNSLAYQLREALNRRSNG
ncbi:MAG: hypothetical protein WAW09_01525 [Smithella sp.]|jgi:hypothetical protein